MYTELQVLVNGVQRNKLRDEDKVIVVKAIQEYYKTLNKSGALGKEVKKIKREVK